MQSAYEKMKVSITASSLLVDPVNHRSLKEEMQPMQCGLLGGYPRPQEIHMRRQRAYRHDCVPRFWRSVVKRQAFLTLTTELFQGQHSTSSSAILETLL